MVQQGVSAIIGGRKPGLEEILLQAPASVTALALSHFMVSFRPFSAVLLLVFALLAGPLAAREARAAYVGAIIVDADSGEVLFEDKADTVSPPASMTKLMTFAVVHDRITSGALSLDTPVTVTAEDSRIGGTQVWLKQGETFAVEELIYAMMIQSGNDTAHALARAAAGSTPAFIELMNAKARALGMKQTTFRTPHGLPPSNRRIAEGDLTSPRDYSILCRYLLGSTNVTKYTSIRQRPFGTGQRTADRVIQMTNHNHLLEKVTGVDGLKTGFTNGAGYCLAASAERNGRRIITIVMGSPDSKTRDLKVIELLERGFATPASAMPTVRTNAPASPAKPVSPPAPKTDQPGPPVKSGPDKEPAVIFRVTPPQKKP
jgi:D-alanyl-D-alanine carboxypeptidase